MPVIQKGGSEQRLQLGLSQVGMVQPQQANIFSGSGSGPRQPGVKQRSPEFDWAGAIREGVNRALDQQEAERQRAFVAKQGVLQRGADSAMEAARHKNRMAEQSQDQAATLERDARQAAIRNEQSLDDYRAVQATSRVSELLKEKTGLQDGLVQEAMAMVEASYANNIPVDQAAFNNYLDRIRSLGKLTTSEAFGSALSEQGVDVMGPEGDIAIGEAAGPSTYGLKTQEMIKAARSGRPSMADGLFAAKTMASTSMLQMALDLKSTEYGRRQAAAKLVEGVANAQQAQDKAEQAAAMAASGIFGITAADVKLFREGKFDEVDPGVLLAANSEARQSVKASIGRMGWDSLASYGKNLSSPNPDERTIAKIAIDTAAEALVKEFASKLSPDGQAFHELKAISATGDPQGYANGHLSMLNTFSATAAGMFRTMANPETGTVSSLTSELFTESTAGGAVGAAAWKGVAYLASVTQEQDAARGVQAILNRAQMLMTRPNTIITAHLDSTSGALDEALRMADMMTKNGFTPEGVEKSREMLDTVKRSWADLSYPSGSSPQPAPDPKRFEGPAEGPFGPIDMNSHGPGAPAPTGGQGPVLSPAAAPGSGSPAAQMMLMRQQMMAPPVPPKPVQNDPAQSMDAYLKQGPYVPPPQGPSNGRG